ncbi:sulfatase [Sphingobium sp. CR2-8]|uniref:sulfatase family protein n=1 Tax=Sphingobium sp. CR2-8 TaxID=1306534 RepID=UPI002DBBA666|nr:sulfatase [Sphingobium sp. CR2-8]MEC3909156.1 sulfatase [Sphingobium sp. CR2-8]
MTRKHFLLGMTGMAATLSGQAAVARPKTGKRPNILFVLADEWRAQAFNHRGDVNARTPALDRFWQEAVSFDQAVAGTPVCCPARASLMTGDHALTHGVYINDVPLVPRHITLGEAFAQAGYQTGYIGKWHLHGSPEGRYERRLEPIPPDKRFGFQYWKAAECTHDYNHSIYYAGDDIRPRYWQGYDAIAQTDDALNFIEAHHGKDDPYFLMLSWGPPHFPYSAPEAYDRLYRDKDLVLRPNVPEADRAKAIEELRGYYAAIAALDDCFARLMLSLDRLGAEDTIVIFASDHGEMAWSQGLDYKIYPWEESVRVPFMLRYPRKLGTGSKHIDVPLNSPDVMPTLLGLAGVPVPEGLQGHDFSPSLLGHTDKAAPTSAFLSMPVPITTARTHGIDAYRGVRTARHTFVRSLHGPWLLYDNRDDPYQMRNRVDDPAMAATRNALERDLDSWLTRLGDDFLPPSAYLQRDGLSHFFETLMPVGRQASAWGDWASTLPVPARQGRSIDTALRDLLSNPVTAGIVARVAPGLVNVSGRRGDMSPRALSVLAPNVTSREQLRALENEFAQLR